MNTEKIMEFFYERISKRVKEKVEKSGKTHAEIYRTDSKLISRIINNKRTRVNPFLISDAILDSSAQQDESDKYVKIGLLHGIGFNTKKEILWGTEEEIKEYLPNFFKLLWEELPDKDDNYGIDKDLILNDYIPYAENSAYYDLIVSYKYDWPFMALYGRSEDYVLFNQKKYKQEALEFLYLKCKKEFEKIFNDFSSEVESFHKIDKVVKNEFIDTTFISLLKKNIPNEYSLGLRVKTIIKSDLSQSTDLIVTYMEKGQINEMKKKLLNAASNYAISLKEIQSDMIKELKSEQ